MSESGFEKGRYVVYGTNGICIIEDVKNMKFAAGMPEKMYYILSPVGNPTSTVFVPAENEKLVSKMRSVMTKNEIDELLIGMRDKELQWENDRRYRSENFHEILSKGVTQEMLLMIRCIYMKKRELSKMGKNLPTTDSNTLKAAEKLVEEEFSYTLDVKPSEVGRYIRSVLQIEDED